MRTEADGGSSRPSRSARVRSCRSGEAALGAVQKGQILRVRLAVDAVGAIGVTHQPLPANPAFWRVVLSPLRLDSADPWLGIKTSRRPVYDRARAALPEGTDEAILLNERGEVCEGTITNLFLRRGDRLLTPPLSCGLLPGVPTRYVVAEHGDTVCFVEVRMRSTAVRCQSVLERPRRPASATSSTCASPSSSRPSPWPRCC